MNEVNSSTKTTLTESEMVELIKVVQSYLKNHPSINNRTLRSLTGIGYDQAIYFFKYAVGKNLLLKQGRGSSTVYVNKISFPPDY